MTEVLVLLVALPIFPDMTDEEVDYVISTIQEFYMQ